MWLRPFRDDRQTATAPAADPESRLDEVGTLEDQPDQDVDVLGVVGATLISGTDLVNIDLVDVDMLFTQCATLFVTKWSDSASVRTSSGV